MALTRTLSSGAWGSEQLISLSCGLESRGTASKASSCETNIAPLGLSAVVAAHLFLLFSQEEPLMVRETVSIGSKCRSRMTVTSSESNSASSVCTVFFLQATVQLEVSTPELDVRLQVYRYGYCQSRESRRKKSETSTVYV